jgi:hypothetical protein
LCGCGLHCCAGVLAKASALLQNQQRVDDIGCAIQTHLTNCYFLFQALLWWALIRGAVNILS